MNTKNQSKRIFQWSLIPVIFSLAWPTMLEQLMGTAVQYIDTAMVGTLGTAATAAVGSTTTVNWLIGSSMSAFGIGFLAYISQAFGAGEKERAKLASAQSVLLTLVIGTVFTVITLGVSRFVPVWMQVDTNIRSLASIYFFILYIPTLFRAATTIFGTVLRAAGDTKTPMRVGVAVNLINIVLNFLLIYETRQVQMFGHVLTIYGAGLGVIGAAAASAVSIAFGGIQITAALWKHREVSPKGISIRPNRKVLLPCIKIAIPNMMQRFCTSFGYVVFASMINALGGTATAAHTIANTVESAFYIPGYGMMTAAATLTGNAIGACDRERQQNMSRMIFLTEFLMMTISGGLLFLFAEQMTGIFSRDREVIAMCSAVLRMVAVSEPFYGISIVTEGMLMGAGKTLRPFIYNTCSMWGVRIMGTLLCTTVLGYGLTSAWACMIAGNMTLMVLYVLYYRSGKWNPLNPVSRKKEEALQRNTGNTEEQE